MNEASALTSQEPHPTSNRWRAPAIYLLMIAAAIGLFLAIRSWGEALTLPDQNALAPHAVTAPPPHALAPHAVTAPPPHALAPHAVTAPPPRPDAILHLLIALATVILLGSVLGRIFTYVGQPPVIGEVVAGILLGPSFFGQVAPDAAGFILPPSVAPFLEIIAQLGVILYMFLIGLEFDGARLRDHAQSSIAIAHASIVVPFVLGSFLALGVFRELAPAGVRFTNFALFMGIALSVTAFPVLARILSDRGMTRSKLGILALGCAAADDVTAWCMLAIVVGITQAKLDAAVWVCFFSVAYLAFMLAAVRPVAKHLALRFDEA
jgi:Kef-type K+ transport system membrane component KefB